MSTPKFKVGDEVVVVVPEGMAAMPGLEGLEGTVIEIVDTSASPGWQRPHGYILDTQNTPFCAFEECALRLKHRPANETWDEMIERLKRPVGVEA